MYMQWDWATSYCNIINGPLPKKVLLNVMKYFKIESGTNDYHCVESVQHLGCQLFLDVKLHTCKYGIICE